MTSELDAEVASTSGEPTSEEGESLLLPLIQGILQNPKYHNLSARQLLSLNLSKTIALQSGQLPASSTSCVRMNSEHPQLNANNRLGNDYLPIEDSGTESGEDLRLLAAGLQSNFSGTSMESSGDASKEVHESPVLGNALGAGLLMEVTTALARLQTSLNLGEIDLDETKKAALLSLVDRLQRGLISPEKITEAKVDATDSAVSVNGPSELNTQERRGSSGGVNRFAKRRNRVSRHTVGVTREELADARRIIEELELIGMQNSSQSKLSQKPKITATVVNSKPGVYNAILTRQFSEPITLLRPSQFVPKETTSNVEFPIKPKYKVLLKQSISLDQPVSILKSLPKPEVTPIKLEMEKPVLVKKFAIQRNSSGSNNKFPVNNHVDEAPTDESSSSDDEEEMVNTKYYSNSSAAAKFKAKENYLRNQQVGDRSFNYSSGDETSTPGPRPSKYTSKKMKMKRANTVDLPKSFSFVNTFDLSDKDCSDSETNKNTYQNRAGLRTTITGGVAANNLPPQFTPKTENDKKFLAFIQKQNTSVTPSYVNPAVDRRAPKPQNWTNKFGNLKNKFENDEPQIVAKPAQVNAAANFWKSIEKEKPSAKVSPMPPVPVVQPLMKALPIVSEKFPWKNEKIMKPEEPVLLRRKPTLLEKFVPKEQPSPEVHRVILEPNKLPVLKPTTVNNFSHAPMSVFKPPISRKLSNSFKPIQMTEEVVKKPLSQVSNGVVRQLAETGYSINNAPLPQPRKICSSPTRLIADSAFIKITKPEKAELAQPVPWAGKPKSERVMNLAQSKFEIGAPTIHMATTLQSSQPEPVVKYRNNPLYNGTFEKRSSLPPNASYATFDTNSFSINGNSQPQPNVKEATFTITDFTQPTSVSFYSPTDEPTITRPSYTRQDSLTNPEQEPLVLTCSRTSFSPKDKLPKTMELYDIPTPASSHISNGNSTASICDDLEHELQGLGDTVECKAAVSRVMIGPVAQTATTQSSELQSLNGSSKENTMMKSLHDSLKKLSQKSPTPEKRQVDVKRLSQESSNSSLDLKHSPFKQMESRLSQDSSSSSIDLKLLPPLKIPVPAVPETAYSITYASPPKIQVKSPSVDKSPHVVYNNVSQQVQGLQRARSSHMLAIPKPTDPAIPPQGMYGASQSVVVAKQKTVQSFFGPQRAESLAIRKSPQATSHVRPVTFNNAPSAVSRKISMYSKPVAKITTMSSLSRSRTMPSLANVELLDESNIDDAFEELLSSTNL